MSSVLAWLWPLGSLLVLLLRTSLLEGLQVDGAGCAVLAGPGGGNYKDIFTSARAFAVNLQFRGEDFIACIWRSGCAWCSGSASLSTTHGSHTHNHSHEIFAPEPQVDRQGTRAYEYICGITACRPCKDGAPCSVRLGGPPSREGAVCVVGKLAVLCG